MTVNCDFFRIGTNHLALTSAATDAAARKPLFEVVPLLPGLLFRSGLMSVSIPVLPTCVGLVACIQALLLRPTPIASRGRTAIPTPCV